MHYAHSVSVERGDTAAFRLGRAVDSIVYERPYVVFDGVRRGKAWDAFQVGHEGIEVFSVSEVDTATEMAAAVGRHDKAMAILRAPERSHQKRFEWEWLGMRCAGTPDTFGPGLIADLKTTRDAHPDRFQRQALWYSYHAQLAWYANGLRIAGLSDPAAHYLIAVESAPPYPVTLHSLTPRLIDDGLRLCRLWMETLKVCAESGAWPGYAETAIDFDAPDDSDVSLTIDGEEVEF